MWLTNAWVCNCTASGAVAGQWRSRTLRNTGRLNRWRRSAMCASGIGCIATAMTPISALTAMLGHPTRAATRTVHTARGDRIVRAGAIIQTVTTTSTRSDPVSAPRALFPRPWVHAEVSPPPAGGRWTRKCVRMDQGNLVAIDLDSPERDLLCCGLMEWGGPARCTAAMAVAIGFDSVQDLFAQSERLIGALRSGSPLTRGDWRRVLLATEIVFVSDVVGSGIDWSSTTGLSDAESLVILRGIQRKVVGR